MKKMMYVCFTFMAILLSSCNSNNSDDSGDRENTDPILGTWSLVSSSEFEEEGTETQKSLTDCEKLSTFTFEADGTLIDHAFTKNEAEDCFSGAADSLTWENEGNGIYTFIEDDNVVTVNINIQDNTLTLKFLNNEGNISTMETYTAVEPVAVNTDPVLGTWSLLSSVEEGEPNFLTECKKLSILKFNSDGTFVEDFFEDDNGNCTREASSKTWKNRGGNTYMFVDKNDIVTIVNLTFEDSTMLLEFLDTDGNALFEETYTTIDFVPANSDPVLGTWKLTSNFEIENGEETLKELEACEDETTLEFKADESFSEKTYEGDDCASESETSRQWQNRGGEKYIFIDENHTVTIVNLSFGEGNNTLTIEYFDNQGIIYLKEIYTQQE